MENFQQFLYFLSGLAIFYFGQRVLSQGLQAIGARSVKNIVHDQRRVGPVVNFLHGARLTVMSFSSTMTSLVIIGLVNANLLKNKRVRPMMMGTALGSSLIFFILSFSGHNRGLNLIALGLIVGLILRSYRYRSFGKFIMGLGLVFLGISVMEEALRLIVVHGEVIEVLTYLNQYPYFLSILVATFCGFALSLSFMSAVVVLGIVCVFARLEVLSAIICFGLASGAQLASFYMTFITAKSSARAFAVRKSFVPFMMCLISIVLFDVYVFLLKDVVILNFSTLELVVNGFFLFSIFLFMHVFVLKQPLVKISKKLFPDDELKEQAKLQFLGEGRFLSSTMAYILVEMEVSKLLDVVDRMFLKAHDYITAKEKGARSLAKIKDYERIVDNIQQEIDIFIQKVISNGSGEDDSEISLSYLKMSSLLEQIADEVDKLSTTLTKYYEDWQLSDTEVAALVKYFDEIYDLFKLSISIFNDEDKIIDAQKTKEFLNRFLELKKEILGQRQVFADGHRQEEVLKLLYLSDMCTSLLRLRGKVRDIFSVIQRDKVTG